MIPFFRHTGLLLPTLFFLIGGLALMLVGCSSSQQRVMESESSTGSMKDVFAASTGYKDDKEEFGRKGNWLNKSRQTLLRRFGYQRVDSKELKTSRSQVLPTATPTPIPSSNMLSLKLHGHWTITATNPDGTVDEVREFDNNLGDDGKAIIMALLAGHTSVDGKPLEKNPPSNLGENTTGFFELLPSQGTDTGWEIIIGFPPFPVGGYGYFHCEEQAPWGANDVLQRIRLNDITLERDITNNPKKPLRLTTTCTVTPKGQYSTLGEVQYAGGPKFNRVATKVRTTDKVYKSTHPITSGPNKGKFSNWAVDPDNNSSWANTFTNHLLDSPFSVEMGQILEFTVEISVE